MPESELRIKTVGGADAVKTFKSIQDSAKSLDRLSTKSSFSSKEIESARKALTSYFKEYKSGLGILREHQKEIALIEKRTSDAIKKQKEFNKFSKEWFEQERDIRRLGRDYHKAESSRDKMLEALSSGPGNAKRVSDTIEKSENSGVASRLGSAIFGGIGLATATGIIVKSITAANSVNDNLLEMGSVLRLNNNALETSNDQIAGLVYSIQKGGVGDMAQGLGYTRQETAGIGAGFARTGAFNGSPQSLLQMLNLQRNFGIAPESFNSLGTATAQGNRYLSSTDMKTITAEAIASGLKRPLGEFVESIAGLTSALEQQGSASPNPVVLGGMLAAMGQGGSPFLQGSRGAAVLSQLNSSLMSPGGGIAGELSMLNVAGFGQKGTSWWDARKRLSSGFGGPGGSQLLTNLLKQGRRYGPQGMEQFLSIVGGLNPTTAEALAKEDRGGALESRIRKMTSAGYTSFLGTQGLGAAGDVEKTINMLKDKGLGPALASVNARASLANSWQDIGQDALGYLVAIVNNTGKMADFLGNHPSAQKVLDMTNPPLGALTKLITKHFASSAK